VVGEAVSLWNKSEISATNGLIEPNVAVTREERPRTLIVARFRRAEPSRTADHNQAKREGERQSPRGQVCELRRHRYGGRRRTVRLRERWMGPGFEGQARGRDWCDAATTQTLIGLAYLLAGTANAA